MEELQPVIKELLEKSKDIEKLRQEEDLHLLKKVLEIYDQKVVAEVLRAVSGSDWSREAINRWVNGKLIGKRLVEVELQMLRSMLPNAPAHYEQSKFRFIDLFAGIGGSAVASKPLVGNVY